MNAQLMRTFNEKCVHFVSSTFVHEIFFCWFLSYDILFYGSNAQYRNIPLTLVENFNIMIISVSCLRCIIKLNTIPLRKDQHQILRVTQWWSTEYLISCQRWTTQ